MDLEGMKTARRKLLEEAADLVDGDRNAQYGDPNQDFQRIATMWNAYLEGVFSRQSANFEDTRIGPHDVAWMMIMTKASRSTNSPTKHDHFADAAGYAACGWDCVAGDVT